MEAIEGAQSNILVVDDSMTMRKIMRRLLLEAGFPNVDEAAERKAGRYDLTYYIPKPFSTRVLRDVIDTIVAAKRMDAPEPAPVRKWVPLFA